MPRLTLVILVVATVGLSSCGASGRGPTVVRVGGAGFSRGQVEHWRRVAALGAAAVIDAGAESRATPLQRALAFLISTAWLRAEAARDRIAVPIGSVRHALAERREANGSAEFQKSLQAAGQTVADVELEVEAELTAGMIRQKALAGAPPPTPSQIAAYYGANRRMFLDPERRFVDLLERLPSPTAALALVRRVGTGPSFSKKALHEVLVPGANANTLPDIEAVTRAVFQVPLGVVSKPMSLGGRWTVFVVRKITAASYKPLAAVRSSIVDLLAARRRREALARFAAEYRKRWTASTRCAREYVVQGCLQYAGLQRADAQPFGGG